MTNAHILLLVIIVLFSLLLQHGYAHGDEDIRFVPGNNGHKANWRYYYSHKLATSTPSTCCETIIVSAVGTAMDVSDYHRLAQTVVATSSVANNVSSSSSTNTKSNGKKKGGVVFVVLDAASKNPDKANAKEFAEAVASIRNEITEKLPHCCDADHVGLPQQQRWLVGGHSSGGRAAAVAVHQKLIKDVHGYLGLAPYLKPVPSDMTIPVPSLSWGFLMESCLVSPPLAALRAYDLSRNDSRILYQVATDNRDVVFKGGHCTFTNHGCKFMCIGDQTTPDMTEIVHRWVAESIKVFAESLESGNSLEKADFQRVVQDASRQVNVAVNQETSPKLPRVPTPIWPDQWSAEFTAEAWGNIGGATTKMRSSVFTTNQVGIYYDYTNGRMLERYDAGQIIDDRCRCTGGMVDNTMTCKILSFQAENPNAYQNKSSIYVVTGNKTNNGTDCCLLHHDDDQGILMKPTWMLNNTDIIQGPPVYRMNGRLCHSWINNNDDDNSDNKPGIRNSHVGYSWLVSERGEICGYKGNFKIDPSFSVLGLSPYLALDPKTYSISSHDDDLFTLPSGGIESCAKPCKCSPRIGEVS